MFRFAAPRTSGEERERRAKSMVIALSVCFPITCARREIKINAVSEEYPNQT